MTANPEHSTLDDLLDARYWHEYWRNGEDVRIWSKQSNLGGRILVCNGSQAAVGSGISAWGAQPGGWAAGTLKCAWSHVPMSAATNVPQCL